MEDLATRKVTRRGALGALAAGLAAAALGLSGCGSEGGDETAPINLALVVGCHANSEGFDLENAKPVRDALEEAASGPGSLHVVVCDGDPFAAMSESPFGSTAQNERRKAIENDGIVSEALSEVARLAAVTPEVDTYAAVNLARRLLSELEGTKRVLVLDTGLATTGVVKAADGILEVDPEAYAEALDSQGSLADLDGCDVVWLYLGDVAAPQAELPEAARENLRGVWEAVLGASGAASVGFSDAVAGGGEAAEGLPPVSTADVPGLGPVEVPEAVVLDDGTVSFLPDKAEFSDPEAARAGIETAAAWLLENPEGLVTVTGHTASIPGFDEEGVALSEARAEAVASVLVELGVEPGRIVVVGVGDSQQVVDDLDENGVQIEERARQNRRVVISFSTEG